MISMPGRSPPPDLPPAPLPCGSRSPESPRLLCRLEDLAATGCREFRLGPGEWPLRGFVLNTPRGVRAYVNRCPHLDYPLNYLPDEFLTYNRKHIQCTMHGAVFEKDSGLCVGGPCLGRSLHALPVCIEAGCVLLADTEDIEALAARFA